MPDSRDIKGLVALVADGLLRREPETSVVEKLVAAGVPRNKAPSMYRDIKTACQQGVQAVVTGGESAPDGPPNDPLLADAFRVGQTSMRQASGGRGRAIAVVVFLVVAAVLWLVFR